MTLVFAGETIRLWAAGHLRKEQVLATGGPYRWIRNPLYLGSFFIAVGFALMAESVWIWGLVFLYFLLCYVPVIHYEEQVLKEKFPGSFEKYASRIPAFYPALRPYTPASTEFTWSQVMRNKEYNAVLGIIFGFLFLLVRAWY